MFCPKCGQELMQGAKFCDKCGTPANNEQIAPVDQGAPVNRFPDQTPVSQFPDQTPVTRPPEIYADYPQTPPEQPKPRKKNVFGKIIAILLIAVILLSAVTVLGYYTFLPAKYTLWAAENFTVQKAYNELDSSWTRLENKTDPLYKEPVTSNTEINFSIDSGTLTGNGLDQQTADLVKQYLTDMTLKLSAATDMSNKKANLSLGLSYQNNPVVSLNGFIDDKKLGLSIPELSQKNIVGQFSDLSRLSDLYPENYYPGQFDSFASIDPWSSNALRDKIEIKHEDIKKLMQTYAMAFVNNLESGDMTIQRGQTTDLLGEETKCQEVTITLNQKAQKALIASMLDTVKQDDNFYNLVFGNIIKVYNLMLENNPALKDTFQSFDIETVLKRSNVNMVITQLKKSIDENTLPEKVTIKAYIKGLDVVKYDVEIPVTDAGETVNLVIENVINGDSDSKRVTLSGDIQGQKVNMYVDVEKQYAKASDTQNTSVEFNLDMSGSSNGRINFKLDNKQDPDGKNKVKQDTTASFAMDLPDEGQKGDFTVTSQGTITRNNDGLATGYDGTVDVNVDMPGNLQQPVKFALAIKNTTEYGKKVEAPDWASSSDNIDLATASREDLDAYFQELNDAVSTLGMLFGGGL